MSSQTLRPAEGGLHQTANGVDGNDQADVNAAAPAHMHPCFRCLLVEPDRTRHYNEQFGTSQPLDYEQLASLISRIDSNLLSAVVDALQDTQRRETNTVAIFEHFRLRLDRVVGRELEALSRARLDPILRDTPSASTLLAQWAADQVELKKHVHWDAVRDTVVAYEEVSEDDAEYRRHQDEDHGSENNELYEDHHGGNIEFHHEDHDVGSMEPQYEHHDSRSIQRQHEHHDARSFEPQHEHHDARSISPQHEDHGEDSRDLDPSSPGSDHTLVPSTPPRTEPLLPDFATPPHFFAAVGELRHYERALEAASLEWTLRIGSPSRSASEYRSKQYGVLEG